MTIREELKEVRDTVDTILASQKRQDEALFGVKGDPRKPGLVNTMYSFDAILRVVRRIFWAIVASGIAAVGGVLWNRLVS